VLTDEQEILKRRNLELQAENEKLRQENEELKKKHDRARGVPAEVLVAQMTGGKRTAGYKDLYDVETENGKRIEVKLSKVDTQPSKRWVWSNVLGPKVYDYLVLAGEKDERRLKHILICTTCFSWYHETQSTTSRPTAIVLPSIRISRRLERSNQKSSSTATWSVRKSSSRTCRHSVVSVPIRPKSRNFGILGKAGAPEGQTRTSTPSPR
jgi:hypothetical protein